MMKNSLNYRGFNILDYGAVEIKAAAAFSYKGYVISMSAVFGPFKP